MAKSSVDEYLIDCVRKNQLLYDKLEKHYKNKSKRKEVWATIAHNVNKSHGVDFSAEAAEKRWNSLRDMFSREDRKQNSHKVPLKQWKYYENMLFLRKFVAHRSPLVTTTEQIPNVPVKTAPDDDYMVEFVDVDSASPTTIGTSSNNSNEQWAGKDQARPLAEKSNDLIANALKSIEKVLKSTPNDGYMKAIEEGLKYVPARHKTQCLIEVLQVIQKYEERF